MLSVRRSLRRSTSSLLLHPLTRRPRYSSLPPPYPFPCLSLQLVIPTRHFSQQNDNSESLLGRLKTSLSDATQVATLMAQEAGDVDLTDDEATTLLISFAKQKRVDDCIGLLQYCQEQRLATEPSARTMAFRTMSDAGELIQSLQLFEGFMKRDSVELKPWMVGRALDIATKLDRPESVTQIFRLVTKNFTAESDDDGMYGMVKRMTESGGSLDEFALRSIAIFADRAGQAELAMHVLELMQKTGVDVTIDVYASVLEACGKAERWEELVKVYELMPDKFRAKLYSRSLSFVVRAHCRSKDRVLVQRGLERFETHKKGKWNILPCNAALEAQLQTQQFDKLFALADEMKEHGVKWDALTYKLMTEAYIESGSTEQAKQMLLANGVDSEDGGAECYRKLITAARGDRLEICQLYMEMLQNNMQLELSEWRSALEIAIKLPDQTMYWRFRRQLLLRYTPEEAMIPSTLLLPGGEELYEENEALLQNNPAEIEHESTAGITNISPPQSRGHTNWKANTDTLTERRASALLVQLIKDREVDECLELLSCCQEQGLHLDSSSRSAAFRALCDVDRFEAALQVFQTLQKDKIYFSPALYGRVLDAAIKLNRQEVVLNIFRRLLRDFDAFNGYTLETTTEGIHAMLRDTCVRGVIPSKLALRSLAVFADRSDCSALALDVLSIMEREDMDVTCDVYGSVLNSSAANKRWDDVLQVYNSMPDHQRSQLNGASLGWVMTASAHVKNKKVKTHIPYNVDSLEKTQAKRGITRKPSEVSDVSLARESFNKIKKGNLVLSINTSSALLMTMAKRKRIYDCIEMLRYFKTHDVHPKPFALLAVYTAFSEAQELEQALHVFETLYKSNCILEPWVYAWAMDAAMKLNRQESLSVIFHRLLEVEGGSRTLSGVAKNFQMNLSEYGVYGMLNDARGHGVHISEFALRSLASFADRASESDLALDVYSMMQDEAIELSSDVYGSVLIACSKDEHWGEVLHVFEDMPEILRQELSSAALGSVIIAHTKSGEEELMARGLEIFDDHPSKWGGFSCNAALEAFLETNQLDELVSLANDMQSHGVNWSSYTYRLLALAHIKSGSIDEARRLLHTNSQRMQNGSAPCYRELIRYYAKRRGDFSEALQLCEEMIENNREVLSTDWCTALELALELPDHTRYWRIRKQMWLRGWAYEQKIPSNLLLADRASPRAQTLSLLRDKGSQLVQELPPVAANVSLALEVFDDIWNAGGSGLTTNIATKLLVTVAKYQRVDECMEMLDYFKEQNVSPKPFGRLAVFRAFCEAEENEQALLLFDTVLQDEVSLHEGDFSMALQAAMAQTRHKYVTKIIDYMRKNDENINDTDYDNILRKFEDDEEWRLPIEMLSTLVRQEHHIP